MGATRMMCRLVSVGVMYAISLCAVAGEAAQGKWTLDAIAAHLGSSLAERSRDEKAMCFASLYHRGRFEQARAVYERHLCDASNDMGEVLMYGRTLVSLHKNHRARVFLDSWLERNPENARLLHFLASIEFRMGEHKKGMELLLRAIKVDPDNPELHYDMARYSYASESRKIVRHCLRVLQLVEKDSDLARKTAGILAKHFAQAGTGEP